MAGWLFPDLSGTWVGAYQYDGVPGVPPLEATGFTIDLLTNWWGRIRGRVQDAAESGSDDVGAISGGVLRRRLSFAKQMPRFLLRDAGRVFPLSQWKLPDGTQPFVDRAHEPLDYIGTLTDDCCSAEGQWFMPPVRMAMKTGRVVTFPAMSGTWGMERRLVQGGGHASVVVRV